MLTKADQRFCFYDFALQFKVKILIFLLEAANILKAVAQRYC